MFETLGHFLVRNRKRTLAIFIVAVIALGGIGSLVFARLSTGGYSDPNSDSAKVATYLTNTFHVKDPAISLIVNSLTSATNPTVVATAQKLEAAIRKEPGVVKTLSFWSAGGAPTLLSQDKKSAYLFIYSKEADPFRAKDLARLISAKYSGQYENVKIYAGGYAIFNDSLTQKISKDLALAESISIPLTFILLAFVFGGLIASAMPLVVGVAAILGAFFALYLISLATGVSIFALNLVTGMGLGLGIDYSLLMVNRFREELHAGKSVEESVARTVATAGRTVFFSGITVMVTLASLMFFPLMFLKSFGYAGVTVVAMALLGALIPLPAILGLLGHRINKIVVRKSAITPKEDGRWAHTARFVMKRPVSVVLLSLMLLSLFAAPLKDIVFSQPDTRVMPASAPAAIATEFGLKNFPGQEANPVEIVMAIAFTLSHSVMSSSYTYLKSVGVFSIMSTTVRATSAAPSPPSAQCFANTTGAS